MGDTNPFRMDGKQQQRAVDIDQNPTELLPRNPYGSNEGTPCGCRLPVVTLQPQWGAVGRLHWSFVVMVRRGRQALLGQPSEGFSSPSAPPQLPALRWLCASREPLTPVTPQAPGNA
ncbi:hypothetical protein CapIbe_020219, partial [Capra ibex]